MDLSTSFIAHLLLGIILPIVCQAEDMHLGLNDVGYLMSLNFPLACCFPLSKTVRVLTPTNQGYLRMTFSDLDLPKGTRLEIFDDTGANHASLFPEQPELVNGVWTRPVLASAKSPSAIHLRLIPSNTSISNDRYYVGFKAKVWVTNSPPDRWHDRPITDVCMPLVSPLSGDRITQKSVGHQYGPDRVIDCVWQIKIPRVSEDDDLWRDQLHIYTRITHLNFTGYLDIIEGVDSEGQTITALSSPPVLTMANLTMPQGGYEAPIYTGLYIRLSMLNRDGALLEFIYGMYHTQSNLMFTPDSGPETGGSHCSFGGFGAGFLCTSPYRCIPETHHCNQVVNCVPEEDERGCGVTGPEPTTVRPSPITTTTTTISVAPDGFPDPLLATVACRPGERMCRDGVCLADMSVNACTSHGGAICRAYTYKFCPHLKRCIPRNWNAYPCDDYCRKCPDNSCSLDGECPGECTKYQKKCPEGCQDAYRVCASKCESWQKKCADGKCIRVSHLCAEERCPRDKPRRCLDGSRCYQDTDRCDWYNDCDDGSDETGCVAVTSSKKYMYAMVAIPLAVIWAILIVTCVRMKRKPRGQGQMGQTSDPPGEVDSGIGQGYTGTRMTTVAPPNYSRHGRGSEAAHLIGHHDSDGSSTGRSGRDPSLPDPSAPPPSYDEVVRAEGQRTTVA